MLHVQHFSYDIDDDYTALYKGMLAEKLLKAVALFQSAFAFVLMSDLFYSAWGFESP